MSSDRSTRSGWTTAVIGAGLVLLLPALCVLLNDDPGDPATPPSRPPSPVGSPRGEGVDKPSAPPPEQAPSPHVRMDVEWPPLGTRDAAGARQVAAAIVLHLPRAGMSDADKASSNREYRRAIKRTRAHTLPIDARVDVLEEHPDLLRIKLLDGEDAGAVYWTPRRTIEGYVPKTPEGEKVTLTVEVAPLKPNGKAWDARGGAPDLAVCTELSDGLHCFPGDVGPTDLAGRGCADAFRCEIADVRIPQKAFRVVVVDVDLADHDPIAGGPCSSTRACDLGAAKLAPSR